MRLISFRGKSIAEEWHYGLLARSAGLPGQVDKGLYISNTTGSPYAYQVIPRSIGEYTGLKDSNGAKIYEGDIITNYHGDIQVVEYSGCQWSARLIKRKTSFWPAQYLHSEYMVWEVIGNTYDNLEMI